VNAKFKGPLATHLRLRAPDRSVAAGAEALLKVKARPCRGRRHDRVRLLRGAKRVAAKRLNGNCVAKFHLRVRGRDRFRARIRADRRHRAAKSRRVTIVAH
jgi:hypothetical protein